VLMVFCTEREHGGTRAVSRRTEARSERPKVMLQLNKQLLEFSADVGLRTLNS
jgi:hypothetical protein